MEIYSTLEKLDAILVDAGPEIRSLKPVFKMSQLFYRIFSDEYEHHTKIKYHRVDTYRGFRIIVTGDFKKFEVSLEYDPSYNLDNYGRYKNIKRGNII